MVARRAHHQTATARSNKKQQESYAISLSQSWSPFRRAPFLRASVTAALSPQRFVSGSGRIALRWPGTQGAALLLNKQNSIK
jgi:hypothetical protein